MKRSRRLSTSLGRVTRLVVAGALVAGGHPAPGPTTPAAAVGVNPDLPCPTTPQTAAATPAGFEIDGNCQVNVAGLLDWESPEVGIQPVAKDGLVDVSQYSSGDETNWPSWTQGGGSASGQADIADIYSFSTL